MIRQLLARLQGRSGRWPALRDRVVREAGKCQACASPKRLTAHHVVPVHVDRSKELDESNLIVLCKRCHFCFAHFYDWKKFNSNVQEDAKAWLKKMTST